MVKKFNPWPYGIIGFFILLFCGIATALAIACTHRESLVSDNYYEQELKFQGRIDAATRAARSGVVLDFDSRNNVLAIFVPPGQLTNNISGSVHFYRPSSAKLDWEMALAPKPDGSQKMDLSHLTSGNWDVRLYWQSGGRDFFSERRICVAQP